MPRSVARQSQSARARLGRLMSIRRLLPLGGEAPPLQWTHSLRAGSALQLLNTSWISAAIVGVVVVHRRRRQARGGSRTVQREGTRMSGGFPLFTGALDPALQSLSHSSRAPGRPSQRGINVPFKSDKRKTSSGKSGKLHPGWETELWPVSFAERRLSRAVARQRRSRRLGTGEGEIPSDGRRRAEAKGKGRIPEKITPFCSPEGPLRRSPPMRSRDRRCQEVNCYWLLNKGLCCVGRPVFISLRSALLGLDKQAISSHILHDRHYQFAVHTFPTGRFREESTAAVSHSHCSKFLKHGSAPRSGIYGSGLGNRGKDCSDRS
ncbi:hypothetical protein SKAU_G00311330 [Synaphobranchus kaupii]|uniref:Uncharacterized protein n=1 Tax=Synaphobranchus kaupii TaxID=118154 RepID=A0A9Q1ERP6_SYNKA|nr:hypothetical protein SKAU_G00311330 [Synaphobranchus kaupii]